MVYGDRRPHLVALIVPDEAVVKSARKTGAGEAGLRRALGDAVDRANAELSAIEKVKRFAVAPAPFTTDNGQMTPTLKIRRHAILERYRDVLDGLY
jgi:long-chain acyl-CoA synthetase